MAKPWLSTVEKLTEFFAADQLEVSARRTKFVQRTSKITGKLFLALVTFGRWSTPKTTVAQLAAKAAQLDVAVDITPEALQQRMTVRAVAFLQELVQTAFAKLHTGDTICEEGIFAPFPRVHIADSTGFRLPESLAKEFPGAGGSGSKAGAKIQLVWEYKSHTFDHFALIPWNVPDSRYVDTVVELAQPHSLFLFDLGYFKLTAFAQIVAAHAYFLSRLNHQTTLREVVRGRQQSLELAHCLACATQPVIEKAVVLGTYERVPARLVAIRMPEAIVNERRRRAYAVAKKRGYTPSQAYLTLLAWNLFVTNVPATVWSATTVGMAYALRWQVELVFRGWKSGLHVATLTTTTKYSTLCYLYGRMLLILLTSALSSPLRVTVWHHSRELSLFKLVRHCQASADHWLQRLFQPHSSLLLFSHASVRQQNDWGGKPSGHVTLVHKVYARVWGDKVIFLSLHWHLPPSLMRMPCQCRPERSSWPMLRPTPMVTGGRTSRGQPPHRPIERVASPHGSLSKGWRLEYREEGTLD